MPTARASTMAMAAGDAPCQGYLFKLKENNKEWKKLYVVLRGTDIIYYDSPHSARAPPSKKDDTKQVVTATPYDEFDGVRPPTGTPSYLMIETTHAKKIYCAKSADDRKMWLENIKKNSEMAARSALQRQASKTVVREDRGMSVFGAPRKESVMERGAARVGGFLGSMLNRSDSTRMSSRGGPETPRARCSSSGVAAASTRQSHRASEPPLPEIPDDELDEALKQMVSALGLKSDQAEKVFKLEKEKKRDMLKGYNFKKQEAVSAGRKRAPASRLPASRHVLPPAATCSRRRARLPPPRQPPRAPACRLVPPPAACRHVLPPLIRRSARSALSFCLGARGGG